MRRMINLYRENVIKMISGASFFAAVIAALIIFATAVVYVEPLGGKEYSILRLLSMKNTKAVLEDGSLNFTGIFLDGSIGYMEIFAPIVASIPYISIMSSERMNSNFRFEIFRVGRKTYSFGNLFAAVTVGGLIMCAAYMVYGMITYAVLLPGTGNTLMREDVWIIVKKLMGMFFYGSVSVIPTVFISAFVRNKYIVLCIPFMLNYFLNMFLSSVKITSITLNPTVLCIYDYMFPMKMQDIMFAKPSGWMTGLLMYAVNGALSGMLYDYWLKKSMEKGGI